MQEEHTDTHESSVHSAGSYMEQLDALEVPSNIDPVLLALWRERELAEWQKQSRQNESAIARKAPIRSLGRLFAAFVGVSAMCLIIVLGLIHGRESGDILISACQVFLFYTVLGYFVGWVAEKCVQDSVETLLREIIRRGDQSEPLEDSGVNTASDALSEGS